MIDIYLLFNSVLGPSYMVLGTRDNPSPETTLSIVFNLENGFATGQVKVGPA